MTTDTLDMQLLQRVCLNNREAMDFLANHWQPYVHEIDDIVDGDRPAPRDLLATFGRAAVLFSHPFYLAHMPALRQVVLNVTVAYADSVHWEKSPTGWQREWADHNRHAGMEMVVAVALICGGIEHALAISLEQRSICWHEHHRKGNAI
jgi:hypothetical protein